MEIYIYIFYLDCHVGYIDAYICQNSSNPTFKMSVFNFTPQLG